MKSREIIIYYAVLYKGNWEEIFNALERHEEPDEEVALKTIKNINSKVTTILDDDYPESLKTVYRPPFAIFYHGNIGLAKNKKKNISVVGCRDYSEYGEKVTNQLVSQLSKDFNIVSGMARGIDGIAHHACMMSGGKTICVLGCGINVCYPPSNLDIYDEARKNHLVMSEYPDVTEPNPSYFPIRNRIVAGLSDCLLVTEGQRNSGTSITATITLNSGGNVCCVPTRIGENSVCNHLISYGAALVETVDDIYQEIGFRKSEPIF